MSIEWKNGRKGDVSMDRETLSMVKQLVGRLSDRPTELEDTLCEILTDEEWNWLSYEIMPWDDFKSAVAEAIRMKDDMDMGMTDELLSEQFDLIKECADDVIIDIDDELYYREEDD